MKTSKKILIGFLLTVVYSIIVVGLNSAGILLGGIPTILLLGLFIFIYKKITKSDNKEKIEEIEPQTKSENNEDNDILYKYDNYINSNNLSKNIFTESNKYIIKNNQEFSFYLTIQGKQRNVSCIQFGKSISTNYENSKWNDKKEISVTTNKIGNTLLIFREDNMNYCPILIQVVE
ncbi:MAG: hypothetical protein IJ289_00815 [Clostridia bacterium]|nr:hypothetical protein [Clostridia bacterium]